MYKIVIHNEVAKRLKTVQKSHLRRLSSLLEVLKMNPVPWRDFDLKKIVVPIIHTGLGLEITGSSISLKRKEKRYIS